MRFTRALLLSGLALLSFLCSGCTPEKARALQGAAVQFRAESLAAVNYIEILMKKEVAPAPRSETAASAEFADSILSLEQSRALNDEIIRLAMNPYTVAPDPQLEKQRADFLADLRLQYSTFASMFDDLERGSFLARNAVKKSEPYAGKLTSQMGAFAQSLSQNPPRLLQFRSSLIDRMEKVRKDSKLSPEEKRRLLIGLMEEWQTMEASEADLQRSAIEQCLKAASLGIEVRQLIQQYDKLSLDDLNNLSARALSAAGELSGKNLESLKSKSAEIFARIKADPDLGRLADLALAQINRIQQTGP